MHLRFTTAGESHGPGLIALIEGVPAGIELAPEDLNDDLARRQLGYGRGGRMKIEKDAATVVSGIRHGRTLGSPIALSIPNRDYANWEERMNPWPVDAEVSEVHLPRPGHADLAGVQKFGHHDVRNVLERASARETTARVAVGAVARTILRDLGVEIRSHVTRIGEVDAPVPDAPLTVEDFEGVDESPVRCLDKQTEREMIRHIDVQRKANETIGGIFEVLVFGLIPGIGSYTTWDGRIEGRLAQAFCSIQAIKGVGFGDGFGLTNVPGSAAHDEVFPGGGPYGFHRTTNHAGGIEGGMTNGETRRRQGRDEAAADADQAVAQRRHRHRRGDAGAARAHRLLHRAGGRRRRRGDGRAGLRRRLSREVRRRQHRRHEGCAVRIPGQNRRRSSLPPGEQLVPWLVISS